MQKLLSKQLLSENKSFLQSTFDTYLSPKLRLQTNRSTAVDPHISHSRRRHAPGSRSFFGDQSKKLRKNYRVLARADFLATLLNRSGKL